MSSRPLITSIAVLVLLMEHATARPLTDVTRVSSAGTGFDLQVSVSIDGGTGAQDEVRGLAVAPDGTVYVAGYVTAGGQGRDIWLGKFTSELVFEDSVTVNGPASGDDEGYSIAFDPDGNLYLVGYVTAAGQGHDVWLGKFDADLSPLDATTVNGTADEDDDGYGILFDAVTGNLYLAGTLREMGEGANIWLAIYDVDLDPVSAITLNGSADDTDKARFLAMDDERRLFVSGSMTEDLMRDYDIWIGKFKDDLTFVDDITVAGPTTDEDKGYGIVLGESGTVFVTGTMIEDGESYNIWLARLDSDLNVLDSLTIDGPVSGEDVAYLMTMHRDGHLFQTGTYTEIVGGTNIWLARFDPSLNLEAWVTLDGPAAGWDTGLGVVLSEDGELYVSAIVSDPLEGLNMWVGRFDVLGVFSDGFESANTDAWSQTSP